MLSSDYIARFAGVGRLYGRAGMEKLAAANIAVIGLGGVGSWAVEGLARSGIGAITLVDFDDVCVSNTNRQIHALTGAIGRPKTEVLRDRVLQINPACRVEIFQKFFTEKTAGVILAQPPDGVIDAIDALTSKCHLLAECRRRKIFVVSSGGCAGKNDTAKIRLTDMAKSGNDRLLKFVRKRLRKSFNFPRDERKKFGIPCVWSDEIAHGDPDGCAATLPGSSPENDALRPNCEWGFGTAVFVSANYGFTLAGAIVNKIAGSQV